jgi:selenocysteine lyase/cysteine desulfurase
VEAAAAGRGDGVSTPTRPDLARLVRGLRDREFPWTAATTYLNNASIGPLPERTRQALEAFNARRTAPHLLPDRELTAIQAEARAAVAALLGAGQDEIALVPSTSTGLNIAARALPLEPGETILVSDREFPANVYPWLAQRDRGVGVETLPVTPEGWPDEARLLERLRDPAVRVLAVSQVQFSTGYRADLDRLSAACRANGTFLVVDAIQGLGHCPLDLRDTPVDVLACGGQKWLLSPWGSGFVYVRRDLVEHMNPAHVGWMSFEGTDDFTNLLQYSDALRQDARRFEVGTVATQDVMAMTVSLGLLAELGIEAIEAYTRALTEPLLAWADRRCVRVVSPRDGLHRCGITCLAPDDARQAHRRLKAAGVVCAFREGAIRFSPHAYNTMDEMEKVVEVLDGVVS